MCREKTLLLSLSSLTRATTKARQSSFFYILPKPIGNGEDSTPAEGITLTDIVAVDGDEVSEVMFYNDHRIDETYYTVKKDTKNLKVTITGKDNYSGSIVDANMTLLSKADADNTKIKARYAVTYDGEPKEFSPDQLSVRDGNGNAMSADDFYIRYEDNINVGQAKAHVIAKPGSGYHGESVIYYDILPDVNKSMVNCSVEGKYYYYPEGVRPHVKVTAILRKSRM